MNEEIAKRIEEKQKELEGVTEYLRSKDLRVIRESAGITQAQLAASAGVHQSQVSTTERGVLVLGPEAAIRLVTVYRELENADHRNDAEGVP